MVEVGLLSVQVRYASADAGVLSGGLLPEWALGGPCSVAFFQAMNAEGLFWVVVLMVAVSAWAEGAEILPGFSVSNFSALKASVGVGAGRLAGMGAVRGAVGAEGGDACLWVVDGQEADDLGGVAWEGDAIPEGRLAVAG